MRNLKEAGVESAAQTQMDLRKAGFVGEEANTAETQYPIRKFLKFIYAKILKNRNFNFFYMCNLLKNNLIPLAVRL